MAGTLTRWDPFAELGELRTRFDRLLDEFTSDRERVWTPAVDVVRDDGKRVLRADIPGIKPEEVKIEVEDDILTLSGDPFDGDPRVVLRRNLEKAREHGYTFFVGPEIEYAVVPSGPHGAADSYGDPDQEVLSGRYLIAKSLLGNYAKGEMDELTDMLAAVASEAEWLAKGEDARFMSDVALRLRQDSD